MLFLTYWKLNEEMSVQERIEIGKTLTEGPFPPEDVEIIRWDGTPDGWGIVLWEADEFEAVSNALAMWRASGTPFFEETKTAPAGPVEEQLQQLATLLEELA